MTPAAKLAKDGGTAFPWSVDFAGPCKDTMAGVDVTVGFTNRYLYSGATLRDYFAAKAMNGLLAQSIGTALGSDPKHAAEYAYAMADAMLKERAK